MATDFYQFPLDDPLVNKNMKMSDIWVSSMSNFYQTLIGFLSQSGIFLPSLTTAQINAIQTPQEGQMVYNITTLAPQIWQTKAGVGAWRTFTTTP